MGVCDAIATYTQNTIEKQAGNKRVHVNCSWARFCFIDKLFARYGRAERLFTMFVYNIEATPTERIIREDTKAYGFCVNTEMSTYDSGSIFGGTAPAIDAAQFLFRRVFIYDDRLLEVVFDTRGNLELVYDTYENALNGIVMLTNIIEGMQPHEFQDVSGAVYEIN